MDAATIYTELQSLASEQIARIYSRRPSTGSVMGVRFGDMGKIAKRVGTNSSLAWEIWNHSDAFEMRHLALGAMDPADVTEEELEYLAGKIDTPPLSDDLAALVHQSQFAEAKRREWTQDEREYVRRAGYCLVHLAAKAGDDSISHDEMLDHLTTIRDEIHASPNWSREMMNYVPVAVGQAHPALFDQALETAKAYGRIEVFHGDNTNCKVVDAVHELEHPKPRPVRKSRTKSA
jgi:hypothetical protein